MTPERAQYAFFSEPYYSEHFSVLHAGTLALPDDTHEWRGCVGVVAQTLNAEVVGGWFPAAMVRYFDTIDDAIGALRGGEVDAVFDADVALRQYAGDALVLTTLPGPEQYLAVAMALGSRTLLNIVDRAIRDLRQTHPEIPDAFNRKTVSHIGREADAQANASRPVPAMDRSIKRSANAACCAWACMRVWRGCARVLRRLRRCERAQGDKVYQGLEPEIARRVAQMIFGDPEKVEFVPVQGVQRIRETRSSWLHAFFALRKTIAIFGTLLGTNWWNLGMAGKLPHFLCPKECVGTLDFVGLDYYWGVASFWPSQLHRLSAAADFQLRQRAGMAERPRHDPARSRATVSRQADHRDRERLRRAARPASIAPATYRRTWTRCARPWSTACRWMLTSAGASRRTASGACRSTTAATSGCTTSISTRTRS